MIGHVQCLDLLYEKETTSKLLEFKLKYLAQYSALLFAYFYNMNFDEVINSIIDQNSHHGLVMILTAVLIVDGEEEIRGLD